ncbi:pentatricopeptide repeat-containing protein At4g38150-like [Malus sylvestris]|uniref:pentatricopeptide repeat-containing protein At4g38150-like n=1 Tax=Malus sylvestris TaxID=3752 RepID=UPI0021ABDCDF|nr:pentatricopeptide repeat-containing protein At4g38150-like [Malus sylvestris]
MVGTLLSRAIHLFASTTTKSNPFYSAVSSRLIAIAAASHSNKTISENHHRISLLPFSLTPFRFHNTLRGRSHSCSCCDSTTENHRRHSRDGEPSTKINTKVNFSLPSDDEDEDQTTPTASAKEIDKSKLPPPYDPFSKKPAIEDPEDPKDLQEVFHKMRSDGLTNNAVNMFDALSKDGLTHEALELFAQIKDKGHMPDVVSHTAVIEAYANAGKTKEALKVYLRMLASGVAPNTYTYSVLIKALAADPGNFLGDAKKYLLDMMGKGMRPNAATYMAVFEGFASQEKAEEGRLLLEEMKGKGFVPDEKAVREVLKSKRGPVVRTVINILFGK